MPLSCSCDYGDDVDFYVYHPIDYSEMPALKRRKRCASCEALIDAGAIVAKFSRNRCPKNDIEEAIYGGGPTIPLADQFLCETCADLFFSLFELGFECVMPNENMRELVREYAETFSA
ncbi:MULTISPECIES: hypothetical protein [Thiorhodovibrio]|uniref:hypothetical protein n=1 Tax=Thiorhodovibrio TaxID=61593 RepID=UPI0019142B2B|nr:MULTISPECIES: hypothetical protein [Thiorhodovibrio]MBK5970462.1 hypothetical protein [Thiorhodovibrio winogradskyi]WPL11413.1 hypothetical protein Thiosp_01148 [Thiorhodovibrio litoralis]